MVCTGFRIASVREGGLGIDQTVQPKPVNHLNGEKKYQPPKRKTGKICFIGNLDCGSKRPILKLAAILQVKPG